MAEMAIAIRISWRQTEVPQQKHKWHYRSSVGVVTQVGVTVCCASLLPPRPHCPGATLLT